MSQFKAIRICDSCHTTFLSSRRVKSVVLAAVIFGTFYYMGIYMMFHKGLLDFIEPISRLAGRPDTTNTSSSNKYHYYHPINRGSYVKVGDLDVAILTAVYYDNNPVKNGYNVFLNGWGKHKSNMNYKCCFLDSLDATEPLETKAVTYHVYSQWVVDMQNAEFSCSLSPKQLKTLSLEKKDFKFVAFAESNCKNASQAVVQIEHPQRIPNSVGICLKVSYGHLNPELIVEWMEYNKALGVTKVFSFLAHDLEPAPRKAFLYYNRTGFLEASPIDPATSKTGKPRGFKHPRWNHQAFVDEVTAINDCKHRMSGLDFVIVHDIDEWIIPKAPEDNIYTIMKKTRDKYPKAGAFQIDSHVFMLDWKQTRASPLHVMQYVNRTTFSNFDGAGTNTRWGFISDRTFYGQNNKAWPKQGYSTVNVLPNLYTLVHRRKCKSFWKDCLSKKIRTRDETITRYEKQMIENMQKLPLKSILKESSKGYIDGIMKWTVPEKMTMKKSATPSKVT